MSAPKHKKFPYGPLTFFLWIAYLMSVSCAYQPQSNKSGEERYNLFHSGKVFRVTEHQAGRYIAIVPMRWERKSLVIIEKSIQVGNSLAHKAVAIATVVDHRHDQVDLSILCQSEDLEGLLRNQVNLEVQLVDTAKEFPVAAHCIGQIVKIDYSRNANPNNRLVWISIGANDLVQLHAKYRIRNRDGDTIGMLEVAFVHEYRAVARIIWAGDLQLPELQVIYVDDTHESDQLLLRTQPGYLYRKPFLKN